MGHEPKFLSVVFESDIDTICDEGIEYRVPSFQHSIVASKFWVEIKQVLVSLLENLLIKTASIGGTYL